jgi:hypothetical protein
MTLQTDTIDTETEFDIAGIDLFGGEEKPSSIADATEPAPPLSAIEEPPTGAFTAPLEESPTDPVLAEVVAPPVQTVDKATIRAALLEEIAKHGRAWIDLLSDAKQAESMFHQTLWKLHELDADAVPHALLSTSQPIATTSALTADVAPKPKRRRKKKADDPQQPTLATVEPLPAAGNTAECDEQFSGDVDIPFGAPVVEAAPGTTARVFTMEELGLVPGKAESNVEVRVITFARNDKPARVHNILTVNDKPYVVTPPDAPMPSNVYALRPIIEPLPEPAPARKDDPYFGLLVNFGDRTYMIGAASDVLLVKDGNAVE